MTMTVLHRVFVGTIDFFRVSINQYPKHVFALLYNFYLCNAFINCLKKEDISKKKAVSILI